MLKLRDIVGKEMMLRAKSDVEFKFTHLITYYAALFYSWVKKDNSFFTRYFHTIDNVIYVPDQRLMDMNANLDLFEPTIRHEYCHYLQSRQEKWYKTKYLLKSKYRMIYELEAYCHDLAYSRNYTGLYPSTESKEKVIRNLSYGSIYMMHIPSKPLLSSAQIEHWNSGVKHLVDMASRIVADEFVARYMRDYGRLPYNRYKELERAIQRLLNAL